MIMTIKIIKFKFSKLILIGLVLFYSVVAVNGKSSKKAKTTKTKIVSDIDTSFAEKILKEPRQTKRSWRDRYEVGPGDVINIAFYGASELDRKGIRIAPDGTISYLQANNIYVTDMTIDEVRIAVEKEISKHYKNARLIITPKELKSKRYFILGKVIDKGVFVLDRPITFLEAIARSRGVEMGIFEGRTTELADFERSFIIRNGSKLAVDLFKLYHEGDLSQNVLIEPNDYIYISSNIAGEYYVFGAVNQPGEQGFTIKSTVVSSISRREGFSDEAWRKRVLVIRGSLENPEKIIVDVDAVLKGSEQDVLIEPGDIIYVGSRPWYQAEQIFDKAVTAFIQSATTTWVNRNIPSLINKQIFPDTDWKN